MPKSDLHEEPCGWLRLHEAVQAYNLPYQRLYKWYRQGLVRGRRTAAGMLVDLASLEEHLLPPGWEWISRALARYGLGRYLTLRLIRQRRLRARKIGRRWLVETASLAACARVHMIPPGWVDTAEVGRRWALPPRTARLKEFLPPLLIRDEVRAQLSRTKGLGVYPTPGSRSRDRRDSACWAIGSGFGQSGGRPRISCVRGPQPPTRQAGG